MLTIWATPKFCSLGYFCKLDFISLYFKTPKRARNEVIDLIRKSKQKYIDYLSDKLRSGSFSSRDWWKPLKGFISPSSSSSIPPLYDTINDPIVVDEIEKANLLNSFFVSQSSLDDAIHLLPNEGIRNGEYSLSSIRINPSEVMDILKTLKVGKASGLNGINNVVLSQAANELATPLCHFFFFFFQFFFRIMQLTCFVENV